MNVESRIQAFANALERIYPDEGPCRMTSGDLPPDTVKFARTAHPEAMRLALNEGRDLLRDLYEDVKINLIESLAKIPGERDQRDSLLVQAAFATLLKPERAQALMETWALMIGAVDDPARNPEGEDQADTARRMRRCRWVMMNAACRTARQMHSDATTTILSLGNYVVEYRREWDQNPDQDALQVGYRTGEAIRRAVNRTLGDAEQSFWRRVEAERLIPKDVPEPPTSAR